ncbi:MAG: limonene-1,2-epoxide hydrolase family protein [Alphaproteobacteria bacterium]|jgi:limonene-1,2-epoxide hydrolase|nr:limonene-1,2-epoxide hydrolase family protein [Alphaproteobacteria bacterium]
MSHANSKQIVTDFLQSWGGRDVDRIMSFFTPDAVYHNVPVAPIKGEKAIREIFDAFLGAFETIALDIVTIAGEGDLVLAERVDRFTLKEGGKYFELPVNGVFELRNGKIHRFSDYFDLQTFESRSGFKL